MYNKENIPYTGKEKIDYGTTSAAKNIAQLKDYIRKSKIKGFTKEQIKNALLAKGWTEKEIEDAYKGT